MPWKELFQKTTVQEVVGERRYLIHVDIQEKVGDLLKKLAAHGVVSALVVETKEGKRETCGIVDILDILTFCVSIYEKNLKPVYEKCLEDFLFEGYLFLSESVEKIYLPSKVLPAFRPSDPLLSVIHKLATGVHRCVVINPEGEIMNIIAQSDIIQFILKHTQICAPILDIPVETISSTWSIGKQNEVYHVQDSSSVYEAFKLLKEKKIGGVAIMDKDNKLLGSIAAADLAEINEPWKFRYIGLDVVDFLKTTNLLREPEACFPSSTIGNVFLQMAQEKVHRVFIVDEAFGLKGVLTLTDVMAFCLKLNTADIIPLGK